MKCPKCQHNQKVKSGMTCDQCRYRFSFNPKERDSKGMTDGRFLATIRAAGQNDSADFTRNQLYGTYCRRQKNSKIPGIITAILFLGFGVFSIVGNNWIAAAATIFIAAIILLLTFTMPPTILARDQFMRLVDRWLDGGKPIEKLITTPSLGQPPPQSDEPDLYDYGVRRLLIVERDELVDLFVLNNVHAEQAMLVISVNGYPNYLISHARRVLEEQPDLPIHLLHDAIGSKEAMLSELGKLNLPLQGHEVIDLGFSADDFKRMKRTRNIDRRNRRRTLPVDVLALPFLSTGLAACFANQMTMSGLLEEYTREQAVASSSSNFG
ncbi:MAG: hypothetical protein KDB00_14660 [Planctomycetales bacterium]|nr:hypothetical protein [Planctomycetales bacterium]